MTRVAAAIAAGLVLVLVLLSVVLLRDDPRLAASNMRVVTSGRALTVNPGKPLCQMTEVPAGTARVRVFAAPQWVSRGGPPAVIITPPRGAPTTAVGSRFTGERPVDIELDRPFEDGVEQAQVCVVNRGPTPFQVAGNQTPELYSPANVYGQLLEDDARLDFFRAGEESYAELAPELAARFGLGKASIFGEWTMWSVFVALAGVWLGTLSYLWLRLRSA